MSAFLQAEKLSPIFAIKAKKSDLVTKNYASLEYAKEGAILTLYVNKSFNSFLIGWGRFCLLSNLIWEDDGW